VLYHQEQAQKLLAEMMQVYANEARKLQISKDDGMINRREAIELLWFDSYATLANWEKKVNRFGYLLFNEDNMILRSEVIRFADDYQSGIVMHRLKPKRKIPQP
jgi:hypothetical protein